MTGASRFSFWAAALATLTLGAAEARPAAGTPEPPPGGARRIVSLAPSVTEAVYALGAADRLVGASSFCDWPPEARAVPRVGSYLAPNVEAILALRPDVVLGVQSPGNRAAVEEMSSLGVLIVMVGESTLADAMTAIETVGRWVDREAQAKDLVRSIEADLDAVRRRGVRLGSRRVLFVVGHDPLVVAGGGLFIDELIRIAGGQNVAGGQRNWPRFSLEAVVAAAPEVIVDGAMGSEAKEGLAGYWAPFASLPAVRDGRVRAQRSDALLRPGPRAAVAARELQDLIWNDP